MAEVANCMKSSTPRKANFGQILSDAADDILSPEVREAMDRIFPQSASQFLQGGLSFEEPFLGVASSGAGRDKQLPFASTATTKNTVEPPVAVSAGAIQSFLGHNLAVTTVSSVATDSQIAAAQVKIWLNKEATVETESKPAELPNRIPSNTSISRADFEIINSCNAGIKDCERAPRSVSSDDIVSDNYNSGDGCDSEDMSRPFVSITREKKKKRRKKMQLEPQMPAKSVSYLSEHNVNSGDEFKTSSKTWNNYSNSAIVNGSGESVRVVLENNFTAEGILQNELLTRDLSSKSIQDCNPDNYNSGSNAYSLDICPVKDLYKDSMTGNEDISNTSNSSAKENLLRKKRVPSQKLPKVKREQFHIVRHVNKIKNTFPPCCVVLRKIRTRCVHNVNNVKGVDNVIPLVERVRCLKHLCDKGYLVCKKNRKVRLAEKLGYLNFLEEALLHGTSDDEFEKPPKRSLRKRANISYEEPGEDDILEEVSSKHPRAKSKDEPVDKTRHESIEKQQVSDVRHETEGSDNKNRYYEYAQHVESNSHGICNKDNHGYPPSSVNSASMYNPNNAELKISSPSQHMMYSQLNSHHSSMAPYLSYLSGVSGGTVLPPYVPSFFPPLPPNISGSLPSHSHIQQKPYSYPVSSMGHDPQQLLMTANAKDFFMQMLSSGRIGAGGLEPLAGLPTVKPVGHSPRPMLSQPMPQVSSASFTTQAMFRPPVPVASVSHGGMMLPTSVHMSSLYGLPLSNRSQQTSSHSMPPTSLPLASSYHGHMNMALVTPTLYTSYGSSSSTTCSSAPTTALASSRNSTYITSTSSSTKAIPVSFAPMPASYISSIQNSMPNQSSHSRFTHVSNLQSKLPTTPGHASASLTSHGSARFTSHRSDRFVSHGSERFISQGSDRFASHESDIFVSHGSERSAGQVPDRFISHGSDRFASQGLDRFTNHGSEKFAGQGAERFANPSLTTQSRMSTMQSQIAERSSAIPNHISQSRTCNIPGPISQSNIPSPVSQPRYNSPSPIAQSNIPSPVSQPRYNSPSLIVQSGSYIPGSIVQSGSYIPSSIAQSGSYIPGSIAQSGSYIAVSIAQSSSNVPNSIAQSRSNIPSSIVQSRSNIPSPSSQARSYIASLISQSRSNIPSPIAQSGSYIPSPIAQSGSYISSSVVQSRSNIPSPIAQSGSYIPSPIAQSGSYIPSPIAQSGSYISSSVVQSRSNIPSPIAQTRSNIPSPSSQNLNENILSSISQSSSNMPGLISQMISNIPSLISLSRSDIPSPISQPRISNIPSLISQSRIPNLPNQISQSRSNMPSSFSQVQAPSLPNQSSQPTINHISTNLTRLLGPNWIQSFPRHPVSACPVRTVIPRYASTITSGCLATSSNSASNGKATSELYTSSVILPQHKRQPDQKLHDQRAVKRRKLEQKYPLPPGVIIKTERLDSPNEESSVNNTPQSLLSHNSHLSTLVANLPASGSEVINQENRSCLGVPDAAACNGERRPSHVAVSLGLPLVNCGMTASTDLSSILLGTSSAGSVTSLATTTATMASNIDRMYTSSTPLDAVAAADCQPNNRLPRIPSCPPAQASLNDCSAISTSDVINYTIPSSAATLNPPKAPIITSVESSALLDIANRPPLSPGQVLPPSAPSAKAPTVTDNPQSNDLQQCASPRAAALSSFKNSLTELHMFVQAQAACGLRADRLEKLRGLLYKKQEQYKALQKFIEASSSDCGNKVTEGVEGDMNSVFKEQRGGSEAEPFVID